MYKLIIIMLVFLASVMVYPFSFAKDNVLIVATTTSVVDSGILDSLLIDFKNLTGITVKPIAVGTGQALEMARRGEADVLLVHSPKDELKFIQDDFGINRRLIMHNDFVLVGPENDPAQIKGKDVIEAYKRIIETQARLVSRSDKSGTHRKEEELINLAGVEPVKEAFIQTGQGMGETLRVADELKAYCLADRGTYLSLKNTLNLVILVEGDEVLKNYYSVIGVNPRKFPKINDVAAKKFSDFLISKETQRTIRLFGREKFGQSLFIPEIK